MIAYLRSLAARLMRRDPGSWPPFPDDSLMGVRAPRRTGPGDRRSAAAVDEPFEPRAVEARSVRDSARATR